HRTHHPRERDPRPRPRALRLRGARTDAGLHPRRARCRHPPHSGMDPESMNRTATAPPPALRDDARRRALTLPAVSDERVILSRVAERGGAVESNDQLGLDFDVEQTAWGRWVDPDRRAAQVRKFLDRAGLEDIPPAPWPEGSPEVKRLDSLLAELFPDMSTAMASENGDI